MRYEINVTTGEVIQREPTASELAQEALDQSATAAVRAEAEAKEAAQIAVKETAMAKLALLGLTDEEISTIVGG